jgi:hypothetical protein
MNYDVAVSLASKNPPGTEAARSGETARDSQAGGNSSDQTIGMARERSGLPPVQPFPLSKDSLRSDQVPPREPAGNPDGGRNPFKNSIGMARAPLPAAERPSIGRRMFRSVASFFIMALSAVLTSIVVSSALQSHGNEAKEMVMTWGSSLGGSSSTWQSRGDEAKRMVKEAWASSLDWLTKKLPPDVDNGAKQKGSNPAREVSIRDASPSTSVAGKPPPVAAAAPFESVQQLKAMAQDLTVVRQKLVQLTAAQQEMSQKIASLQALQQDIKQKESSPPSSPAAAVPLRKNGRTVAAAPRSILRDWRISHARNGYVYVQGHGKIYRVVPGTPLPGVGPVEQIKRQNGRWVVMTPKGLITSMRDLESDDDYDFDGD